MAEIDLDTKEIQEGAPFAFLSYIFLLWILVFVFKRDNRFAYFHAKQGIVISIGNIICIFFSLIPVIGGLFGFLQVVLFFTSLYGIYLSLTGKCERIRFVSDIADKLVI